jgi:hypothetical protein
MTNFRNFHLRRNHLLTKRIIQQKPQILGFRSARSVGGEFEPPKFAGHKPFLEKKLRIW